MNKFSFLFFLTLVFLLLAIQRGFTAFIVFGAVLLFFEITLLCCVRIFLMFCKRAEMERVWQYIDRYIDHIRETLEYPISEIIDVRPFINEEIRETQAIINKLEMERENDTGFNLFFKIMKEKYILEYLQIDPLESIEWTETKNEITTNVNFRK